MNTPPEIDTLIADLEASALRFWIDRNASLSRLELLGEKAGPALGVVLRYLHKGPSRTYAARVFRSAGIQSREHIPTLIHDFVASTETGDGQKAVGAIYAIALLKPADDQYTDNLQEFFTSTIANSDLDSGVRFCSALGAQNHGFLEASDVQEAMYEHVEALVTNRSDRPLFPPLAVAEPYLPPGLPEAFRKHDERTQWAINLDLPRWVEVHDAKNPGPLESRISAKTPVWLVNAGVPTERCNIKTDNDVSESDIAQFKQEIESGSFPVRQYRRVSVKWINIGKANSQKALEHIHTLEQSPPKQLRQIGFSHYCPANGSTTGCNS